MSTTFAHLLLLEFSLWVFVLVLACSCSNYFWTLYCFFFPPDCHLQLLLCQLQINRAINQMVRAYNQGGIPSLTHVFCTSVYPRTPNTASLPWDSDLCFIVLMMKGYKYAKASCQDGFALPVVPYSVQFMCANECITCLSSKMEAQLCTSGYVYGCMHASMSFNRPALEPGLCWHWLKDGFQRRNILLFWVLVQNVWQSLRAVYLRRKLYAHRIISRATYLIFSLISTLHWTDQLFRTKLRLDERDGRA